MKKKKKKSILYSSPVTVVFWEKAGKVQQRILFIVHFLKQNMMQKQSNEGKAMHEIFFVVSCWSTNESFVKARSGFISSPALNLLKPFPEIQICQMRLSHCATFSSATWENTGLSFPLPTAFPHHLCNVRTLAVPFACYKGSSFPNAWSYGARWLYHMGRAGQKAVMGAVKPTGSSAAAAGEALPTQQVLMAACQEQLREKCLKAWCCGETCPQQQQHWYGDGCASFGFSNS